MKVNINLDKKLEYQTVILAALLSNIGKVLQLGRGSSLNVEGTSYAVSERFISTYDKVFKEVTNIELLKVIVKHYDQATIKENFDTRTKNLIHLLNKANALSLAYREKSTGTQKSPKTPLTSVFQRIFMIPDTNSLFHCHPFTLGKPNLLPAESIFPASFSEYAASEIEKNIQGFIDRWNSISLNLVNDFHVILNHFLALLQIYTSAIPADTQEIINDVSLYDHTKIMAAIAASLYQYYEISGDWEKVRHNSDNSKPFYLLVGDVSGIQKYVFDIASGGGTARRLRARSLFVQMISEVAPLQILDKFNLPYTNIIMASGGKFYILLPALIDTEKRLEEYHHQTDDWFLEYFKATLGLNLAWVSCSESGLGKGFGETLKKVMTALDTRKEQGLSASLVVNSKWNSIGFILSPFGENQRACPSCGKFSAPENGICQQCNKDVEWGKILPKATLISIIPNGKGEGRNLLDTAVNITQDTMMEETTTSHLIRINDPDISELNEYTASFKYIAKHVPNIDFQEIAEKSHGRKYLAFLKADVDNLGGIFTFGLRGKEERWDTASRIASMSRQLDLFFTGWIEHLLESDEFKECYCVFSGGDDLFIVGPWNKILEFASRLNEDFKKYTCQNKNMTLSAGIVIENPHYPIGQAAEEAENAVKISKNKDKNRITLLGQTLTWEQWEEIKKTWEKLRTEPTKSAFLYSLLNYARMWKEYKGGNVLGLRFQPLLSYNLRRNINRRDNPNVYAWAEHLLEWRPNSGNKEIENTLDNLELIARLNILWKEKEEIE